HSGRAHRHFQRHTRPWSLENVVGRRRTAPHREKTAASSEDRTMTPHLGRRHFLRLGLLGTAGLAAAWLSPSPPPPPHADPLSPGPRARRDLGQTALRPPPPRPPLTTAPPPEPVTPAYLTAPPAVIPIDVGRQLFVDDFLVSETDLTTTHHRPTYHAKNPVL